MMKYCKEFTKSVALSLPTCWNNANSLVISMACYDPSRAVSMYQTVTLFMLILLKALMQLYLEAIMVSTGLCQS